MQPTQIPFAASPGGLTARFVATVQITVTSIEKADRKMSSGITNLLLEMSGDQGRGLTREDGEGLGNWKLLRGPIVSMKLFFFFLLPRHDLYGIF